LAQAEMPLVASVYGRLSAELNGKQLFFGQSFNRLRRGIHYNHSI